MDHEGAVPLAELLDERRQLLDIAFWVTGDSGAAEEVVAETYRRWYALSAPERGCVTAPRAWLVRVGGDICLSRTTLPGPRAEHAEVTGTAGTATERAEPTEPAGLAGLADLARGSLRGRRSRPTTAERHDTVVRAVREACATEDPASLASLLAPDAIAFFDGGGKVRALIDPVHGNERIARSLLTLLARRTRITLHTHSVNGRTGLVARCDDRVAAVIGLDVAGHQAVQVWVVLNPDKLRSWNQQNTTGHH
ncbi:RNA polymerase subunit sigma [Streptomyces sp. BH-SS-21]|uniref:RNA polymerase subunit sigma n=1 Tax=Streptomyces liliiviolaceus TaxID=2823109 RepID=A0A941B9S9_9ACTN|nr:RNA polymerase subunit sigma [Streptomyces liliiviolaceus]MBQ0850393.1 RNA polymerase subunit sigma [Streptomyces liliiviolaceus]